MTTQLTTPTLKALISQVLQDAFYDLQNEFPDELPAEPTPALEDPPAILQESVDAKLMKVLNQLPRERRKVIFNRFGYYTQNALLRNISNTQKATKGNL
tara:strand:- start:157 stop:453 length:297 start_codon:yes stop_codon:yes gene_type:complete